jgi:outer membrane murein-binding lipoprotein Lpp
MLSRFESRDRGRKRRRMIGGMVLWTFVLGIVVLIGYYAYVTGADIAAQDTRKLATEADELAQQVRALEAERDGLRGELDAANASVAEWRQRYEADVPAGELNDLLGQARERIAAGIPAERLAFVMAHATAGKACEGEPQTKRFLVQTPIATGAAGSVGFANGTVTVTGEGASDVDAGGNPLARYDPAKAVTLHFIVLGGATTEAAGPLPLFHSVVVGNTEYRFAANAGDGGFVNITGQGCAFP